MVELITPKIEDIYSVIEERQTLEHDIRTSSDITEEQRVALLGHLNHTSFLRTDDIALPHPHKIVQGRITYTPRSYSGDIKLLTSAPELRTMDAIIETAARWWPLWNTQIGTQNTIAVMESGVYLLKDRTPHFFIERTNHLSSVYDMTISFGRKGTEDRDFSQGVSRFKHDIETTTDLVSVIVNTSCKTPLADMSVYLTYL